MNRKRLVIIVSVISVLMLVVIVSVTLLGKNKEPEYYRSITGENLTGKPPVYTPPEWHEPLPDSYGKEADSINVSKTSDNPEVNTEDSNESLEDTIKRCRAEYTDGCINKITGAVKNEAYKNDQGEKVQSYWGHLRLEFDLYDSSGNLVHTVNVSNQGLGVGQEWEFEAPVSFVYKATTFKLASITHW